MEDIKRARTALRGAFTRTVNTIKENLESGETDPSVLETLLEQLRNKASRLQDFDAKILDNLSQSNVPEEDYVKEFEACELYNEKVIFYQVQVQKVISPRRPGIIPSAVVYGNDQIASPGIASSSATRSLKLPEVVLKPFDGDPRSWLNFWNTFQKIHEDSTLDDHSKFVYLIQATTPNSKAREIVESFPTTPQNYGKAIQHLKNRFGDEGTLIQIYVRDLLQLVLCNNSGKKDFNLSSLYDNLETKLRSLESLGVTEDKFASILYPLVESALPADILRIWEREREKTVSKGKSELNSILEFLKNEVISEERIMLARSSLGFEKSKKHSKVNIPDEFNVSTACELYVSDKNVSKPVVKRFDDLCIFCDKPHISEKCFRACSLSYEAKKSLVLKKGACFICLRKSHVSRNCKAKVKCVVCSKRHLAIMCQNINLDKCKGGAVEEGSSNAGEIKGDSNVLTTSAKNFDVLMQTLLVRVRNGNKEKIIRAIIDTGSERSYVANDVINELNYNSCEEIKLVHKLFGGVETNEKTHFKYKINVSSIDNKYDCSLYCLNHEVICSEVRKIPKGPWINELKKSGIQVSDLEGNIRENKSEIKLLIGADVAGKLLTGKIKTLENGLVAVETRLGWVLMGKIPGSENGRGNGALASISLFLSETSAENLWNLDIIGIKDPVEVRSQEEVHELTMKYFKSNLRVDSDGRYEVALPWVLVNSRLPSNRELAERRLVSTRKKLLDSGKIELYEEVFNAWERDKIVEVVNDEKEFPVHYLPHRPVFKDSSKTTKVRPVFDASAHVKGSVSLNDCLEKGPNLIEIIPSLLSRFRKYSIGVVSDIEKAFLMIGIRENDRDYLRFLWKDNEDFKIYRHRRLVFGLNCSPFILAATLNHLLDSSHDNFSATAQILKESFYVDNCVRSFKSVEELNKFVVESQFLLSTAKFNLRGWESNYPSEVFPPSQSENVYVLGLNWDLKSDTLSCKIHSNGEEQIVATKRALLSWAHRLYDPIGFTSPVTLLPKLILQECWTLQLKWDEDLPENLRKRFLKWATDVSLISTVQIPRWINLGQCEDENISLHIFCDSSKVAYATCIFLRVESGNQVFVNFVQSRARVAPLKPVTVPRLELLSCCIGARLGSTVVTDLKIPNLRIFYWSDSTTALSWIQRDVRWGTFVWNRVQEIRKLTQVDQWRHIPSELNPADLPSRGCSVKQFLEAKWWEGPSWLTQPESCWPQSVAMPDENIVSAEKRKTLMSGHGSVKRKDNWYYNYFSSYLKIIRMLAWMIRFCRNSRGINVERSRDLSSSEIDNAETRLMIMIQREEFKGLEDEKIRALRPFLDNSGVIRIKSQVLYRDDKYNFRCPIVLPSHHTVVHLLISSKHKELMHAGVSLLMTHLREKFWILKARKTIRGVIHRCVRCVRFKSKGTEAETIPLPYDRVAEAEVFQTVGVDLAGPLYLKGGHKTWIVLYTCAVYRAIHLELTTSLSTDSFLQTLRRFISRRGRPSTVYSDNGANFVGAERAFSEIDWQKIASEASIYRIKWKFNPPTAAWWGGWWERLIQTVKQILRKVLGRASLSYEELLTVLCECERVVNNRPLTYVSEDPEDLIPLTPSRFLQDVKFSDVSDIDDIDAKALNKRAQHRQQVIEHLRQRFRLEYLGQLRQQSEIVRKRKPLVLGDVVLIESEKKRVMWTLARVIELIPGKDGVTRLARVKTETGELLRPLKKLHCLELDDRTNLNSQQTENSSSDIRTRSGRKVIVPERLTY